MSHPRNCHCPKHRRRTTGKPTKRQTRYLRFLERATDTPPLTAANRHQTSQRISELQRQYVTIYDRQPVMRG